MAIDGVFLSFLTCELSQSLTNARINKLIQPNQHDFILTINNSPSHYQLLISANLQSPRIHLTTEAFDKSSDHYHFGTILRRHIERGIITSIKQIDNDRIIQITIDKIDELGDMSTYHLFFEIMGRNTNLVLTTDDNKIIDSLRRFVSNNPNDENSRLIIPKATYSFPTKTKRYNPFVLNSDTLFTNLHDLEGVSQLLINELTYTKQITPYFTGPLSPTLFTRGDKRLFYAFDLLHLSDFNKQFFPTLSELLDRFYQSDKVHIHADKQFLTKKLNKEINKQITKLSNLNDDLTSAQTRLNDQKKGHLIQAYLYDIHKGDSIIKVPDYESDEEITISLDPLLEPLENMHRYFTSYKKAQSAIKHLCNQIAKTNQEIIYLRSVLDTLAIGTKQEIAEIKYELSLTQNVKTPLKAPKKLAITSYQLPDALILVGKNHLQNDYLTNKLANKNDYWFHVKDHGGAHVIIKTTTLDERLIRIGAQLAALYSPAQSSSSVAVDYTLVKNLKKVPNMKGFFVTYTNQSTIYIDPDWPTLKTLLE